jgi:hypothetical protein
MSWPAVMGDGRADGPVLGPAWPRLTGAARDWARSMPIWASGRIGAQVRAGLLVAVLLSWAGRW